MSTLKIDLPKILVSENPESEYGFLEEIMQALSDEPVKMAHVGWLRDGGSDVSILYVGKKPSRKSINDALDNENLYGEVVFK